MKTREQIIEDFFRARGWEPAPVSSWVHGDNIYSYPPIDKNFNLFREHVIEVMQGYTPIIKADYDGPYFYWDGRGSLRSSVCVQIENNQWLLAAIEAATLVLRGEQDAK